MVGNEARSNNENRLLYYILNTTVPLYTWRITFRFAMETSIIGNSENFDPYSLCYYYIFRIRFLRKYILFVLFHIGISRDVASLYVFEINLKANVITF